MNGNKKLSLKLCVEHTPFNRISNLLVSKVSIASDTKKSSRIMRNDSNKRKRIYLLIAAVATQFNPSRFWGRLYIAYF